MKIKFTLFIILAVLSGAISCTQGCLATATTDKKYCISCYLRKPLITSFGCSPQIPSSDHCAIYRRDLKRKTTWCVECQEGWALVDEHDAESSKCIKGKVQYCANQRSAKGDGTGACLSCADGRYSLLVNTPGHYYYKCIKISNPIKNCV